MKKEVLMILVTLIVSVVLVIAGYNVGSLVTTDEVKRDICQAISVKTEDYINCNAKNIDNIIKVLPKIDKEIK